MQFLDIFVSKGVFCLDFRIITMIKSKNGNHCSGAPNENIFQNHLNIALLNVF